MFLFVNKEIQAVLRIGPAKIVALSQHIPNDSKWWRVRGDSNS